MQEPKDILKQALNERIASNANYSLRAFARDLQISPQQLSNVINGRKGLSPASATALAERLGLSTNQKALFCESARAKFSRNPGDRLIAKSKLAELQNQNEVIHLQMDLFKIISSWYHLAIVDLIKIEKIRPSRVSRLAARLGIPELEARLSLERLSRLNLISLKNGMYHPNQNVLIADLGVPTEGVRNFHKQVMAKATLALESQTEHQRYGSSSSLPIKVKDLKRAKKLIQDFRTKFSNELADANAGDEVFGLSIQFFQLSETLTPKTKPEKKVK